MRSTALSTCSVLTGRFRSASFIDASNLARSNSIRRPSFLTIAGKVTSGRSYVVKRFSQEPHWRLTPDEVPVFSDSCFNHLGFGMAAEGAFHWGA